MRALGGSEAVLAHGCIRSRYRAGRHGVDTEALDNTGVPSIYHAMRHAQEVVIDEIGRMELFLTIYAGQ